MLTQESETFGSFAAFCFMPGRSLLPFPSPLPTETILSPELFLRYSIKNIATGAKAPPLAPCQHRLYSRDNEVPFALPLTPSEKSRGKIMLHILTPLLCVPVYSWGGTGIHCTEGPGSEGGGCCHTMYPHVAHILFATVAPISRSIFRP